MDVCCTESTGNRKTENDATVSIICRVHSQPITRFDFIRIINLNAVVPVRKKNSNNNNNNVHEPTLLNLEQCRGMLKIYHANGTIAANERTVTGGNDFIHWLFWGIFTEKPMKQTN